MTPVASDRFALVEEDVLGERMAVFANRHRSLRELLDASAQHGGREYLVDGDRRLTFAEHHRAVANVAAALRDVYGVRPGDRVAILGANRLEWVVTFWATVVVGAVAVGMNAWWSGEELAYGLDDADPVLLVADDKRLGRLGGRPRCRVARMDELTALLTGGAATMPDVPVDEDDPAVILYTSGTTGRPKGAVHSHRCLVGLEQVQAHIAASRPLPPGYVPPPARILTTAPLFHVSGLHSSVVANAGSGATTVWQTGRFDPVEVMRVIEREKCTQWSSVPTAVWRVVNHPDVSRFDLSSLQHVGGGGSSWSPALQQRMREVFGMWFSWGVGYGLTEGGALSASASAADLREHPTTVGRPVATVQVEIRDADGNRLPDGEEGEIWIRGPLVMLGYWRNQAATEAVLGPGRWLRSGDFGAMSDGRLFVATRRHDLILRAAENVYPVEVENVLEEHDDVAECVVVGLPHEELGQEVAAVVVPREGADVDESTLASYVATRMAHFKVPTRWFLTPTPLPRTATGKVVRGQVLDRLAVSDGGDR